MEHFGEWALVVGVIGLLGKIIADLVGRRNRSGNASLPCDSHQVVLDQHGERLRDHEVRLRVLEHGRDGEVGAAGCKLSK